MPSHGRLQRRVRRMSDDPRVELTPMIDVVFLLLTFFVFSIVLMVRADVLNVRLPDLSSGQNAERVTPITIAITESGDLVINREPVTIDEVIDRVNALKELEPEAPLLLAVDTRSESGVMIEIIDLLVGAGLSDFSFIGRDSQSEDSEPNGADQP